MKKQTKGVTAVAILLLLAVSLFAKTTVSTSSGKVLVNGIPFFALGVFFEDSLRYQELRDTGFNLINLAHNNWDPEVISCTLTNYYGSFGR